MFHVNKSIHIDFAHHVSGHSGACINIHGHTWEFGVGLKAEQLNELGFVVDFKDLKTKVLEPVHTLLDHGFALSEQLVRECTQPLKEIGTKLVRTREDGARKIQGYKYLAHELCGAKTHILGGIKVISFPFNPTSERLAEWLYRVSVAAIEDTRVRVAWTQVKETLHPVESTATFIP